MKTEHWALVVSVLALIAAIGIPVWQSVSAGVQARATRRSVLLQSILNAKTTTIVTSHDLLYLLQRHGSKMAEQQRATLAAMHTRMRQHFGELEQLHDAWADFKDGESLSALEVALAQVNVIMAEAMETSKLIDNGRKSYEDT